MSEEQAQQLMQQVQMLEQYAVDLAQRESTLAAILKEAQSAVESVRSLGEGDDFETLNPVGMGVFIKSRVSSKDKVVLNVGAGAVLEKDRGSALNFLEEKIKEAQVALHDTSVKKQDALNRLEHGRQEINRLLQSSQQQG